MSNKITNIAAGILLLIMFCLAVFSIKDDTFTFDETSHIAAGYSYLTQKDYRLNPEHPPLIKDLAAFPLLFLNLNFPKDDPNWLQETPSQWWTQFDFATRFLYKAGNNPDQILFWSRLMMVLLLVFLGWLLFYFAKKQFGNKTALLALFFFSFSPTFLAHGRLVTTDVGAALGIVLSTYFWLKFLRNPNKKNVILAGLMFGIAMLLKFNLVLLIPFFGFITLIYAWLFTEQKKLSNILKYLGLAVLAGIIGLVFVIWPVYQYHVSNYPSEQQMRDVKSSLESTSVSKSLIKIPIWMSSQPILRPFSQYLLGLFMAINRSATGNTTFFMGLLSAEGWKSYFPIIYFIKESMVFHILTLIALIYLAWLIKKPFWQNTWNRIKEWVKSHFTEFSMLTFLAIYWLTSLTSKLNIGVRHLLPAFPFTFILVACVLSILMKPPFLKAKVFILAFLISWQMSSVTSVYPHFLAYFNQAAGGPDQGYLYAVDSNLDWGQDLKRLESWLENNNIDKIYLDYFGGGNAEYYLKEKFLPWQGERKPTELPTDSYLAVSASQLQGGRGIAAKGYEGPTGYYNWLNSYTPVAKIGYSIFVYRIY